MSPFCKTKRLKKSAHIHTEADTKTMPASAILQAFKHHLNGIRSHHLQCSGYQITLSYIQSELDILRTVKEVVSVQEVAFIDMHIAKEQRD